MQALDLNLTQFSNELKVRKEDTGSRLWDPLRSKWVQLAPEEMVRQLLIRFFLESGYPGNRMAVERQLSWNDRIYRFDLLVYDRDFKPWLLVECKAPAVVLTETVLWQIAKYNLELRAPFQLVTNGRQSYCFALDFETESITSCSEIPQYPIHPSGKGGLGEEEGES